MAESSGNNKGLVKASLKDSGFPLFLLILAVMQFGWIIWPDLGFYLGMANAIIISGIIIAGLIVRKRPK